jgi:transposase
MLQAFVEEIQRRLVADSDTQLGDRLLSEWVAWAQEKANSLDPFGKGSLGCSTPSAGKQLGLAFERVGLETGSTAAWLYSGLRARGVPAVCIDPRRLRAVTKTMRIKNDRNFDVAPLECTHARSPELSDKVP